MLARMPRRRCDLPVPRRVLRFLAGGCRRSLWATLFGHLLTCLTYGRGQCRSGGYCTASWIATTFGLSLRSVKAARRHLLAIDVLQTIPTSCLVRNRHGAKMLVNLQWSGPTLTPQPAANRQRCDRDTTRLAAGVASHVMPRVADDRRAAPYAAHIVDGCSAIDSQVSGRGVPFVPHPTPTDLFHAIGRAQTCTACTPRRA
jgi:hypothetical protein